VFETFIGLVALSAFLSLINHKWLKLPDTIGVMILAIITSLILGAYSLYDEVAIKQVCTVIHEIDFKTILFDFLEVCSMA